MLNTFSRKILKGVFKCAPFNLCGDLKRASGGVKNNFISCLLCTSNRPSQLASLLSDFSRQTLNKGSYEIIILNDGDAKTIQPIIDQFSSLLPIQYHQNQGSHKFIGQLRNRLVEMSAGSYILFLDDDTRILQPDFLSLSLSLFEANDPDCIIPKANALLGLVKPRYDYLDKYSFANRCCLYKRKIIEELAGFRDQLASYEDIELGIRICISNAKILITDDLQYFHPPLYFSSMQKPFSIGQSILKLRKNYSLSLWLLVYFNAIRFLPLCLFPTTQNLQWFKISLGVLASPFLRRPYYY